MDSGGGVLGQERRHAQRESFYRNIAGGSRGRRPPEGKVGSLDPPLLVTFKSTKPQAAIYLIDELKPAEGGQVRS